MRRFKDIKGREWELVVTVRTEKRVRALTKISLFRIHEGLGDTIEAVLEKAVDILFAAIEPQAKAIGVTDEDFGSSLNGELLRGAWDSLLDEIYDFFLHWNPPLASTLRKARELSAILLATTTEAVDSIHLSSAGA